MPHKVEHGTVGAGRKSKRVIALQAVGKSIGQRTLFQDVSFHIHAGERIGIVGPNGSGKSTLFQIILGRVSPDTGSVSRAKNVRMGYLPQQMELIEGRTVLAYALEISVEVAELKSRLREVENQLAQTSDPRHLEALAREQTRLVEGLERVGGYDLEARGRKILYGLGFRGEELDRPVAALSGGWLMRLELARLLLEEPELLLLDEPTNHLDLDSVLWLEDFLRNTKSAILLVSHDRAFLNRLVERVVELEQGRFQFYVGNYDRYLVEKDKRLQQLEAARRNQQERVRQLERFIARNRSRKDRARQVQSRLRVLEKIERVEVLGQQQEIHFQFPEPERCGKRVLVLEGVDKAYGDHLVFEKIDLTVERGDRIAFLGSNGAGKSTLLRILAGQESINGGKRQPGHRLRIGYYAQHQWEQLEADKTVLEEATGVAGSLTRSRVRGLLGAFLFRGDDVDKKVSVLSGGEKARLILCKLLMRAPNVLLLDEPTNHLDIPSRRVLERALHAFTGTVCFISHDREFINAIASKVLVVYGRKVHLFPGNYDDYQRTWRQRIDGCDGRDALGDTRDSKGDRAAAQSCRNGRRQQQRKRLEAQWRNEFYRLKQPHQHRLDEIEAALDEAHEQLDETTRRLTDPESYQNSDEIRRLQMEYRRCKERVDELSAAWEDCSLQIENLEQEFWRRKEELGKRFPA